MEGMQNIYVNISLMTQDEAQELCNQGFGVYLLNNKFVCEECDKPISNINVRYITSIDFTFEFGDFKGLTKKYGGHHNYEAIYCGHCLDYDKDTWLNYDADIIQVMIGHNLSGNLFIE